MFPSLIISSIVIFVLILISITNLNLSTNFKEFTINQYLKVKLEQERTMIYVKNAPFRQCMYLLMNINTNRVEKYDLIESIDHAAEVLDRSMERVPMGHRPITPEEEFIGHCSNLQVWVENDYDTRLLHRNLAFPLLKRLTEVGDPLAKKRFKDEIALRYASGHPTVITFLTQGGYLKYLNQEELECLLDDQNIPILNNIANGLRSGFENFENDRLKRIIINSIKSMIKNFGMHNILFIVSQILKNLPQNVRIPFLKILYDHYHKNKQFPLILFLNKYIQYFEDMEFEYIKYNDKIIAIKNGKSFDLSDQNIELIDNIEGFENNYANVDELDLSNNQIKNLRGIEKFTNLRILKISNNHINSINGLDSLKKLQKLSLRNNHISEIRVLKKLSTLKYLDLSGNSKIEKIPDFLNELHFLDVLKLEKCGIKHFSANIAKFFWMGQNYRYYTNYTADDIRYYEQTHKRKASSNNQLYKHFVLWLNKMKSLMKKQNFTYQDMDNFENFTQKRAIWAGKTTKDFDKWLFYKFQRKITEFF
jgi:hypothetical protein